jgi:hypothetical protein
MRIIDDLSNRTSREPDGNVGPYYFWLGDAFEDESGDPDLDDDPDPAQGTFRFD